MKAVCFFNDEMQCKMQGAEILSNISLLTRKCTDILRPLNIYVAPSMHAYWTINKHSNIHPSNFIQNICSKKVKKKCWLVNLDHSDWKTHYFLLLTNKLPDESMAMKKSFFMFLGCSWLCSIYSHLTLLWLILTLVGALMINLHANWEMNIILQLLQSKIKLHKNKILDQKFRSHSFSFPWKVFFSNVSETLKRSMVIYVPQSSRDLLLLNRV